MFKKTVPTFFRWFILEYPEYQSDPGMNLQFWLSYCRVSFWSPYCCLFILYHDSEKVGVYWQWWPHHSDPLIVNVCEVAFVSRIPPDMARALLYTFCISYAHHITSASVSSFSPMMTRLVPPMSINPFKAVIGLDTDDLNLHMFALSYMKQLNSRLIAILLGMFHWLGRHPGKGWLRLPPIWLLNCRTLFCLRIPYFLCLWTL